MTAYAWWPMFRITPDNGVAETLDFRTGFLNPGVAVRTEPSWSAEGKQRLDINKSERPRMDGWRVEVELELHVWGEAMPDHEPIARLVSAAWAEGYTIALSCDAGVTYRDVVLTKYGGPDPIAGKTFVGAKFKLTFRCVDLIDDVAAIASGSW